MLAGARGRLTPPASKRAYRRSELEPLDVQAHVMAAAAVRFCVKELSTSISLCSAQQLSHSKQAQIDIKDVANSKLRKELHTQSVEASEAAARLENQEKSIHTTAEQLTRSRQEVRPGQIAPTASQQTHAVHHCLAYPATRKAASCI